MNDITPTHKAEPLDTKFILHIQRLVMQLMHNVVQYTLCILLRTLPNPLLIVI